MNNFPFRLVAGKVKKDAVAKNRRDKTETKLNKFNSGFCPKNAIIVFLRMFIWKMAEENALLSSGQAVP